MKKIQMLKQSNDDCIERGSDRILQTVLHAILQSDFA